jgi:radical SAM-linked protein
VDKTRLRIRFTKTGDLRWISHKDLARLWERLLRRANLEMVFSEGFHPKPRINFPSALALGIEALDEIVELEVKGKVDLDTIRVDIERQMPAGMELLDLASPEYGLGKARVIGASYQILIPEEKQEAVAERIAEILADTSLEIQREKRVISCNVSDEQFALDIDGPQLRFSIPVRPDGAIRPAELLEYIGLPDLLETGAVLQRTHVHLSVPEVKVTES